MPCYVANHFLSESISTKSLEWYIQMHKQDGYEKIVAYNHTLGYSEDFKQLFVKYQDFIELKQQPCYPNFFGSTTQIRYTNVEEVKRLYPGQWFDLQEFFKEYCLNECYLDHKHLYKYITINDRDESITPRFSSNTSIDLFQNDKINAGEMLCAKNYRYFTKRDKQTKMETYLNQLRKTLNYTRKIAYHFKMSIHLRNKRIDLIFKEIGIFFKNLNKSKPIDYSILISDETDTNVNGAPVRFHLTIENKQELIYLKKIHKFHVDYLEPMLEKNKALLNSVAEPFNRPYIFLGNKSTSFLWGKTIHNTLTTNTMNVHYGEGTDLVMIPVEQGHLSHFIKQYNIHWANFPINELKFDFNYFNCYFKPIMNDLGLKFQE